MFPVLTPLAVDPGHPFPFSSNLSLSLAVEARDPDTKERKFARVKVPESLPRFVPLEPLSGGHPHGSPAPDAAHEFLPLEQLIAANLEDLFPGMEMLGCFPFRVTRDMDLEILRRRPTTCCRSSTARCGGGASGPACGWRSTPASPNASAGC